MQYVSVYDKIGTTAKMVKEISLWNEREDFQLNEEIFKNENTLLEDIQKNKTDILIMAVDNSTICTPKGMKHLTVNFTGLHIIVIGYAPDYKTVREYFLNGVFDYLVQPLDKQLLTESILRVYDEFGLGYVMNDLHMKTDALINNIFLGGGQENVIITNIIEQIYADWNQDSIHCQIISDKAKNHIYEIITERKPWLEKFLYRNDFIYHIGFSLKNKDEIIQNWIKCFREVSDMVIKYQMIDDKLVYRIGKYVVVHVDEKLTLDSVAAGVYLNPSYVSHIFKKVTGMRFVDYMAEVRIDRAKVLLRDSKIRICDVSNIVGYSNPEYFTKTFKKKTGYTPVDYQKILQEKWKMTDVPYSEKVR